MEEVEVARCNLGYESCFRGPASLRMANQTVKDAMTIKGTNPQYLVEKIIRYIEADSPQWTPEHLAKSLALYIIRHLGNIQLSNRVLLQRTNLENKQSVFWGHTSRYTKRFFF